ncbi:hypothetical protein G7Y79_00082g100900 [Physcia stellaris]|nr:hypothetical protein G7Y79_00082g100900 [Physcia stellaris]
MLQSSHLLLTSTLLSVSAARPSAEVELVTNKTSLAAADASNFTLNASRVVCNAAIYRHDLRGESCLDALAGIGDDQQYVSFGPRHTGHDFYIPLPYRWISSDGLCVFDIFIPNNHVADWARMNDFNEAAAHLTDECLSEGGEPSEGGIATGIGLHSHLSLIMTSYKPTVRCSNPVAHEPRDCDEILLTMLTSRGTQTFGPAGVPGVQVHLPFEMANGTLSPYPSPNYEAVPLSTFVALSFTRAPALASWYQIWEEVVAVEGMCADEDREGMAYSIGSRRNMFLELKGGSTRNTAVS